MRSYSSREVIALLKADGWYEVGCVGSHQKRQNDRKASRQRHPSADLEVYRKTVGAEI